MPLLIRYELEDAGWACAWIGNGTEEIVCAAAWEVDSIAELLRAACFYLQGAREEGPYPLDVPITIPFFEASEGAFIVRFDRPHVRRPRRGEAPPDPRALPLTGRVVHNPTCSPYDLARAGQELFAWTSTAGELADTAHAIATDLLRRYGFRGYGERWVHHDFPLAWYARLLMLRGESELSVALGPHASD